MAGFNYGYERNKMEQEFEKIAAACRAEGIPEDTIGVIHRILLDEVNSDRRFYTHTQSYDRMKLPDDGDTGVEHNPLMKDYLGQFSTMQPEISEWGRMDWIDDLDTPEIIVWVRSIDESDRLLLTLLAMDGLKQCEIARILEKHGSAISRKLKQLRKSLAKVLPERLKQKYTK